jgi:hypothetical protein
MIKLFLVSLRFRPSDQPLLNLSTDFHFSPTRSLEEINTTRVDFHGQNREIDFRECVNSISLQIFDFLGHEDALSILVN